MKALTIHAPWAWAIVAGHKRVDNRTWSTSYRGTLAIHAGASRASDAAALKLFKRLGIDAPAEFTRGAIIGTVELVGVVRRGDLFVPDWVEGDPFTSGPVFWLLGNPRALKTAIECAGQRGLWTPSLHHDAADAISKQAE